MLAALLLLGLLAGGPAANAGLRTAPVIPSLEGPTGEHVREIAASGAALGNSPDVFAKVGDSITESGSFLQDLACEEPAWGRWGALAATRDYYGADVFPRRYTSVYCGLANSFSRASAAAVSGWSAANALLPLDHPPAGCAAISALSCEYRLLHPSVALVMYGTNDVESYSPEAYRANLEAIVERSLSAGVIPVLSTIPPRLDHKRRNALVRRFNRIVAAVASEAQVPLWNYWRSLQSPRLVHSGISADGVHPSIYGGCEPPLGCRSIDFTPHGLRYGYNQRNLGALRVLDRIRAALEESSGGLTFRGGGTAPDVVGLGRCRVALDAGFVRRSADRGTLGGLRQRRRQKPPEVGPWSPAPCFTAAGT